MSAALRRNIRTELTLRVTVNVCRTTREHRRFAEMPPWARRRRDQAALASSSIGAPNRSHLPKESAAPAGVSSTQSVEIAELLERQAWHTSCVWTSYDVCPSSTLRS